jgi:hypothetical protein
MEVAERKPRLAMAAESECPICHYRGATIPYAGGDQVQCPRCERVFVPEDAAQYSADIRPDEKPQPTAVGDWPDLVVNQQTDSPPADAVAAANMDESHEPTGEFEEESTDDEMRDPDDEEDEDTDEETDDPDDDSDDYDVDSSGNRSGRLIRMRCPNCSSMVELARRTVDVSISVLWDRMQVRNESIRVRCPECSTLVQLQRRAQRKSPLNDQMGPESTAVRGPSDHAPETGGGPFHNPLVLPDLAPRKPSAAWQLLWPKKFRPADTSRPAKPRSHRTQAPRSLPLKQIALAAMFVSASAVLFAAFLPDAGVVAPLCILGVMIALGALAVANGSRSPRRWPLISALFACTILLLAVFYPSGFGQKYNFYRHPELSPEFVRMIPKLGRYAKEMPENADWVDASKFRLERDWFQADIQNVSLGPVQVCAPSGSGPSKTESCLTVAMYYGRSRGVEPGSGSSGQNDAKDEKIEVTVLDSQGKSYAREDLMLLSQRMRARSLGRYSNGLVEETLIFKIPETNVDALRVEIRVPNLGTSPLRFTIPKTMIVNRTTVQRSSSERSDATPSKNDE